MFLYSPLDAIVCGHSRFISRISSGLTPLFRRRLDEKFRRGAENQAFLVESVTGIETLKAMAVEPQMQRRWEEQLAGYVAASFRVLSLGNAASQSVQLISKLVTAATLYYGAKLVVGGELDGRRTGRIQHAGRPGKHACAATRADLAGFSSSAPFGSATGRHPQHRRRARLQSRRAPRCRRSAATSCLTT